jgi:hypothetical protein
LGEIAEQVVTVHSVIVILILIAAKDLVWLRGTDEILRCAQNDGILPARERLPFRLPPAKLACFPAIQYVYYIIYSTYWSSTHDKTDSQHRTIRRRKG